MELWSWIRRFSHNAKCTTVGTNLVHCASSQFNAFKLFTKSNALNSIYEIEGLRCAFIELVRFSCFPSLLSSLLLSFFPISSQINEDSHLISPIKCWNAVISKLNIPCFLGSCWNMSWFWKWQKLNMFKMFELSTFPAKFRKSARNSNKIVWKFAQRGLNTTKFSIAFRQRTQPLQSVDLASHSFEKHEPWTKSSKL